MVTTLRPGWIDRPDPRRLAPNHRHYEAILAAHRRSVTLGLSTYRDPASGAIAMTAQYLADRGYCCSAGCRHCPYVGGDTQMAGPGADRPDGAVDPR